ncbi:MAG: hypothetical protein PHU05_04020 [Bacilli bacterium]|nr:hypothetical protein [Bacilli bacterium]
MNAEDKLLKIIKHYGVLKQLKYFQSEVFELNEAVINYENSRKQPYAINMLPSREHIAEEIADVMVMLEQFRLYFGIDEKDVVKIKWEKVERQLERIENER